MVCPHGDRVMDKQGEKEKFEAISVRGHAGLQDWIINTAEPAALGT